MSEYLPLKLKEFLRTLGLIVFFINPDGALLVAEEVDSFSLMLSSEEQLQLQKALGLTPEREEGVPQNMIHLFPPESDLFLSAILFLTPNQWTVWINNQPVSHKNSFPGILLRDVQREAIAFSLENVPHKIITLKPNQTYTQGRVLEGDSRPKEVAPLKVYAPFS